MNSFNALQNLIMETLNESLADSLRDDTVDGLFAKYFGATDMMRNIKFDVGSHHIPGRSSLSHLVYDAIKCSAINLYSIASVRNKKSGKTYDSDEIEHEIFGPLVEVGKHIRAIEMDVLKKSAYGTDIAEDEKYDYLLRLYGELNNAEKEFVVCMKRKQGFMEANIKNGDTRLPAHMVNILRRGDSEKAVRWPAFRSGLNITVEQLFGKGDPMKMNSLGFETIPEITKKLSDVLEVVADD